MKTFDKIPNIEQYLIDMKECEQDKEYHYEGNVLIHTNMVLQEVEKLSICEDDKEILRYAAALHDIGKPYCSELIDGHIRSHGHSRKGYHIAMQLLENVNISLNDKIQICHLILNHGKPGWIIDKKDPIRGVIEMSMMCRLDLLYYLCRCDVLGRICTDGEDLLTNLEYFKEYAIEHDCFYSPFNFSTEIIKYNYLVKQTHHYSDISFDDTKSKVYMVCGLPGSGKDYYIKKNMLNLPVISLDNIRNELKIKPTSEQGIVIQTAKERARQYMRKGEDFIWNATNITAQLRNTLISLFNDYNSYITIIFVNKPLNKILTQNKNRDTMIPENVIIKLHKKMEIPTDLECHKLIIV